MQDLSQRLETLGLSDYEARVYAELIQHSPANATFLAKKCHLSRSSIYTTLATLMRKGLVSTTQKNDVKQFIAEPEEALEQLLAQEERSLANKRRAFAELQPELRKHAQQSLHIPNVTYFEGQEGLKKAYLTLMRSAHEGETLRLLRDEFIWKPEWSFVFETEWRTRVKRFKTEKRLVTKLLVNHSKEERLQAKLYARKRGLEVRTLPKQHTVHDIAQYILGDTIVLLSLEQGNLLGMTITNASLAQNYATLFDALWAQGKKL